MSEFCSGYTFVFTGSATEITIVRWTNKREEGRWKVTGHFGTTTIHSYCLSHVSSSPLSFPTQMYPFSCVTVIRNHLPPSVLVMGCHGVHKNGFFKSEPTINKLFLLILLDIVLTVPPLQPQLFGDRFFREEGTHLYFMTMRCQTTSWNIFLKKDQQTRWFLQLNENKLYTYNSIVQR